MTNIVSVALALILAIESNNGKHSHPGDGGRALGHYQMWPIAVEEVNRVYHTDYTLSDRSDPVKAKEMCEMTMNYHYSRGVTNVVNLACRWRNPRGNAPQWHRNKIKKALEKLRKEELCHQSRRQPKQ